MKRLMICLLLLVVAVGTGCTPTQVQQTETAVDSGLNVVMAALDGVYPVAQGLCTAGMFDNATCTSITTGYNDAGKAVGIVQTIVAGAGSLASVQSDGNYTAAFATATGDIAAVYEQIVSLIGTAKGGAQLTNSSSSRNP
ncbi:MAG: hypothetical protein HQK95_09020 [Nitrospirae bacterium]|nr:hypothetical protein [Nitrospirota bacterium]